MKRNQIKSNKFILKDERWLNRSRKKRSPLLDKLRELDFFHKSEYVLSTMLGYCL